MNKEETKEYQKKYRETNKEKLDATSKAHYYANKDSKKDGLYTVYYLKEEHYAGMTSILTYRLSYHKSVHNRHIENVEIIGKYENKKEATRVEAALHSMGYNGRNPTYKQQTLKQLL